MSMFERLENTYNLDSLYSLSKKTVCILGLGGGGCVVAEILARTGVRKFILVDGDVIEESNKNRQICALDSTLGKYKVDVIAERLKDINPDASVVTYKEAISKDNCVQIICSNKTDIVCDTTDGDSKLLVADICKDLSMPYVTGGCGGYSWFTAPIDNEEIVGRDIWGYKENFSGSFSPSPNPATIFIQGGFQAQEVINMLLERDWNMNGKKIMFNHMDYSFSIRDAKEEDE